MVSKCSHAIDAAVYLLGGLPDAEVEAFVRHLDGCPACRVEIEELAPVARLLIASRSRLGGP